MDEIYRVIAQRLLQLDGDDAEGLSDKMASAAIVVQHLQSCHRHLQTAGFQAWLKALFNAWATSGRFGGTQQRCCFCNEAKGDSIKHFSKCSVLSFYSKELVPELWNRGYRMQGVETFLGADALFPEVDSTSVLLAAWIDAVHCTVTARARSSAANQPLLALAARLRSFGTKFGKGQNSIAWLNSGIVPSNSSMAQWT